MQLGDSCGSGRGDCGGVGEGWRVLNVFGWKRVVARVLGEWCERDKEDLIKGDK